MCYFCHEQGNNKSAPSHRSENCRDPRNSYSRFYKSINDLVFRNNANFFVKYCEKCGNTTYHTMHANNGYEKTMGPMYDSCINSIYKLKIFSLLTKQYYSRLE